MITALSFMFLFALLSYVLGRHITHKFFNIYRWQEAKKKRLAIAWAVSLGCLLLSIKRCQYQAAPIDPQMTYVTLSILQDAWLKKHLNGCLWLSTLMGIIYYLGMQSYIQMRRQQQRFKLSLSQSLMSNG